MRYSTQFQTVTEQEAVVIEGGLIGPDQDLNDFPKIIWPYIRTVSFDSIVSVGDVNQVAISAAKLDSLAVKF